MFNIYCHEKVIKVVLSFSSAFIRKYKYDNWWIFIKIKMKIAVYLRRNKSIVGLVKKVQKF